MCNGDCNQGRSCDCGGDEDDMSTSFLAVLTVVCILVFIVLTGSMAGVLVGIGERIARALARWWPIVASYLSL